MEVVGTTWKGGMKTGQKVIQRMGAWTQEVAGFGSLDREPNENLHWVASLPPCTVQTPARLPRAGRHQPETHTPRELAR